jgi:competence protein CoiA
MEIHLTGPFLRGASFLFVSKGFSNSGSESKHRKEGIELLTAITKKGKKLCLADDYKKNSLQIFRDKEEFHCPSCNEKVVLKLGDKRIYHFAHQKGAACPDYYERESEYHMEGKKQIYHWLKKLDLHPVLEQYDAAIRQRPDIVFISNNIRYAIEFQCSPIPASLFKSRTNAYLENQYIPLWILGGNQLNRKGTDIASLSGFHYLFLRKTAINLSFIPYFCSEKRMFILLNNIQPFSPRNAIANFSFYPLDKMLLTQLFNHENTELFKTDVWTKKLQQYKMGLSHYQPARKRPFLKFLYEKGLNPFLLPAEVGLPVQNASFIETSPVIWQAYLFADLLHQRTPGDTFSFGEACHRFNKRRRSKEILTRELPLLKGENYTLVIREYLDLLVKVGVLSETGKSCYRMKKNIEIPSTSVEQQANETAFYQQFQKFMVDA